MIFFSSLLSLLLLLLLSVRELHDILWLKGKLSFVTHGWFYPLPYHFINFLWGCLTAWRGVFILNGSSSLSTTPSLFSLPNWVPFSISDTRFIMDFVLLVYDLFIHLPSSDTRIDCLPNDKNDNNKSHFSQNTTERHQIRTRNITECLSNAISERSKRNEKEKSNRIFDGEQVKYAKIWQKRHIQLHFFVSVAVAKSRQCSLRINFFYFVSAIIFARFVMLFICLFRPSHIDGGKTWLTLLSQSAHAFESKSCWNCNSKSWTTINSIKENSETQIAECSFHHFVRNESRRKKESEFSKSKWEKNVWNAIGIRG